MITRFPYQSIKIHVNSNLDIQQFITNYLISRTRIIIENTLRILTARFRIFRIPILGQIDTVSRTKACVVLQNFLMGDGKSNSYCPNGFVDNDFQGKKKPVRWREIIVNDTAMVQVKNIA